jgi:UDP-glucuronate 4-epimerase
MKILVTGAAGFIGAYVAKALCDRGDEVIGVDNFSPYYDVQLKRDRVAALIPDVKIREVDLADQEALSALDEEFDVICHLAAQAGVRYSIDNPMVYEESNLRGFLNILEFARQRSIKKLVYASSSSVYGKNKKVPFSVDDPVDHPVSLYAATKKANELMAHAYHDLYGIEMVGLRFFTVYGPWGRPDMAYYSFSQAILAGKPIKVFNNGEMERDFTFIDDIVKGVLAAIDRQFTYRIFNLGNSKPERLHAFIDILERSLEKHAKKEMLPMQPGDVERTFADISQSEKELSFSPSISLEEGLPRFVEWFKEYQEGRSK